jgi:hypothetical protein
MHEIRRALLMSRAGMDSVSVPNQGDLRASVKSGVACSV